MASRPPHPPVPPPLRWKDASNIARWLMGHRQQIKARQRCSSVPTRAPRSLTDKVAMLIWPWRVNQYPGQARALADLLGIELRSAELLIGGHGHVAPKHLRRMADFLEASIATKQAVLAELQAHVEMVEKERAMHPNRGYQNGIMKWRREQALAKASGTSTDR